MNASHTNYVASKQLQVLNVELLWKLVAVFRSCNGTHRDGYRIWCRHGKGMHADAEWWKDDDDDEAAGVRH
jgi:hypothetical protein